jgi:CubicO group peptidase (beta-lactamase class C family)
VSAPVKFLSGNGGLLSTATDYMIFSQMLLNKGEYNGVRLLQSKTIDLMTSNHISNMIMPDDDFLGPLMLGMGFGFGFAILQDNIRANTKGSKGSYWWAGAGNTYFYIDPKEELILILMTQFVPSYYYPINKEFRELVYQSIVD